MEDINVRDLFILVDVDFSAGLDCRRYTLAILEKYIGPIRSTSNVNMECFGSLHLVSNQVDEVAYKQRQPLSQFRESMIDRRFCPFHLFPLRRLHDRLVRMLGMQRRKDAKSKRSRPHLSLRTGLFDVMPNWRAPSAEPPLL